MTQTAGIFRGYSLKERDWRWGRMRAFLRGRGLDGLLVVSPRGGIPGIVALHLHNWGGPGGAVIFPLEGEPVFLTEGIGAVINLRPDAPEEERPWIKDIRAGVRGAIIIQALKDRGLERAHVGVVGLGPLAQGWEGWIPFGTWERVTKRLPDCKFEDVGQAYGEAILVHSDEQLAQVRRGSRILEQACLEMVKMVRSGLNEAQVYATFLKAIHENGASSDPGGRTISSDPNNLVGAGPARWLWDGMPPRVLQPGDIVNTEYTAWSGGMQAQVQMCVAIPPVSSTGGECAKLAHAAYEAGLRNLRPGKTFEEVEAAMAAVLDRPGVWTTTPLIHSLNPLACIGRTSIRIQESMPGAEAHRDILRTGHIRGGDLVIQPGMVFEFEPNACIGRHRVNIGGAVLVTEGEPEELNKVPTQMRIAGAA